MFSSKSLSKQKTTNTSCQTMPGMSSATPAVSPVVANLGVEDEEAEVATTVEVNYKVGDFVRITGGNLADYSGVVQEINTETGRVKVTISMFGRETSADLALNQVELA